VACVAPIDAAPTADEAIGFREVYRLLNLRCRTGHTALSYARRGMIRGIRLNARTMRYSRRSVMELIAGNVAS
jgi:hypothetical protein